MEGIQNTHIATKYIFRILQSSPLPTKSGEICLSRRTKNSTYFALWWYVQSEDLTEVEAKHTTFSSIQLLSRVQLSVTPWTAACQASLSITSPRSLFKLMSIESVMPSNHLILCHSPRLSPSTLPSIRVFSNESVLHIMWPKYWRFSFSISSSNDCSFSRNCISNFLFFSFSCAGDAGMTLSRCWAAATTCPQPGGSNRHT